MKKHIINILFFVAVVVSLTGCLKSYTINADPDATTNTITMEYVTGATTLNSGLAYFGNAALTYPPSDEADTATFSVIIGGGKSVASDVTVTLGADNNAILDNFSSDSITYTAMPDSLYHLVSNTATIKAGTNSAVFQIVFYPSKIDPSQNFMLPLTVTSNTANYTVSSNFGHIYFHTIGNPIAGAYNWAWTRYNAADTLGDPNSASFTLEDGVTTIFSPNSPTQIEVQSGYGDQNGFNVRYVLSFKNTNGVLSDPTVALDANDIKSNLTPSSIAVLKNATILLADFEHMHFRFTYQVANSAGAARTLIDEYVK